MSLIIVVVLIVFCFLYYRNVVCKQIFVYVKDMAYSMSAEAVNKAVMNSLNNLSYDDLISIEKNSDGDIILMQTNPYNINKISRSVSNDTQKILSDDFSKGVKVPFLAFTGIPVISGYGKEINFRTVNVISTVSKFNSDFKAVGVNQTLHSIYVDVVSEVVIEVPFNNHKTTCSTEVLISEAVLPGKVPDIYLNGGLFAIK